MRHSPEHGRHGHQAVDRPHLGKDHYVSTYDQEKGQDVDDGRVPPRINQATEDQITQLLREFLRKDGVNHE